MRKKIIFLIMIFLAVWACKSPMDPEIEEILEEANIRVNVEPYPIFYNYNYHVMFTAIFTEHDGVSAELQKLWMLTYYDDSHFTNSSFSYMCPKKLRAEGKLELTFDFYAGRLCYAVEVNARFLDENGHKHHIKKKFRAGSGYGQ